MRTLFNICLATSYALALACCADPESPAAKREWSELEAINLKNTARSVGETEIVQEEGHSFICVESNGNRIWVMLDAKQPPYYKQIPNGNYNITAAQLQAVKDSRLATPTVLECLLSHLNK